MSANIKQLVTEIAHHVDDHKAGLFFRGRVSPDVLEKITNRFTLVRTKAQTVAGQLGKIREAAEKAGCKEVLAVFDEEVAINEK